MVDLNYKLTLGQSATLIDEEPHDCLGNEVGNVLFNNGEVAKDKVLDDASLHDNARTLLLWVGTQGHRYLIKEDFGQVTMLIDCWPLVHWSEMILSWSKLSDFFPDFHFLSFSVGLFINRLLLLLLLAILYSFLVFVATSAEEVRQEIRQC